MKDYKQKIIDFIEGREDPDAFYIWLESNPQVFDWLQDLLPSDKTTTDLVPEKIDYFLKNLDMQTKEEIYSAYQKLRHALEANDDNRIECGKNFVELLCGLDAKTVNFTDHMNLLLYNYRRVLSDPDHYKPSYVEYMLQAVKEFFEESFDTVQEVPYNVKTVYSRMKTHEKIWTCVNIQSWLYHLMTEIYPDEVIEEDESLYEKASFLMDVCPEYVEGHEIDKAGIIEKIVEQVPETIPKGKRKKMIKELIKQEFHLEGTKYPRWVQGGEWPVSKSGKPMRFVEQKRKKGKGYENMLYTIYTFEDVDTGEIRTIDQFT